MLANCCEVERGLGWYLAFVIAVFASETMVSLCLVYLLMDRVLVVFFCRVGSLVLKTVYVARWSVMGGEIVPVVVVVWVSVVSTTSRRVAVACVSLYLVGVVIVVCRLFSRRKSWNLVVSCRRLMLMSPCMVIDVLGCFV